MVGAGERDVVQVESGETVGEARDDAGVVDEAEVLADLRVAGVVPVAEGLRLEAVEEELHLRLVGHGVAGGQVFEAEDEPQPFDMGEDLGERFAERVQMAFWGPAALVEHAFELALVLRGADQALFGEIRARAERELGPKFNVRTFHDALLVEGPLPLALLDQRMDAWIAEQKAK